MGWKPATLGLAILVFYAGAAWPQQSARNHPEGLTPIDPAEAMSVPAVELTRAYIPEAIDLSDRLPEPGDQGLVGSCVSWATAYAARSYYNLIETGANRSDKFRIGSPAYLHQRIRNPAESCAKGGSNILFAMRFLESQGIPSIADVGADAICSNTPQANPNVNLGFRISGYSRIYYTPNRAPLPPAALDKVKQQLAGGNPVLISMQSSDAFKALGVNEIYRGHERGSAEHRGHALVAVGYDDRRGAFRLLNSWGTDWADGGYGWISYESFRTEIVDAWIMKTAVKPPKPAVSRPTLKGKSVTDLDCADLRLNETKTSAALSGFVQSETEKTVVDSYYKSIAGLAKLEFTSTVAVRPWPVCEALLTLSEPLAAASLPVLSTVSGKTTLRFSETLGIKVTAPDFPSFLYLVYLQADGKVVNLLPRRGQMRQQTPPGTVLTFGDGEQGRSRFRVGPPSGTEAVIAIAARSPIAEIEALESDGAIYKVSAAAKNPLDPSESPPDRAFLSALRTGMLARPDATALQREIAAAVLHLKIEP